MSVLRQLNVLGQMRVDVPHIRSIESSIAADFDVVVGRSLAGDRGLVVRGFTLSNVAVGTSVSDLLLLTADGIVYNVNASESGSFLWVPADRAPEQLTSANGKVTGSFTANAVNYVGIDFKRSSDSTTTDLVQFLDANTLRENGRNIPLGRTLDYVIIISSAPFSTTLNICPIAKITTDINNKVTTVQDSRQQMYRLGAGGDFPNTQSSYAWPFGRQENSPTNLFTGGDKNILSNKDWMDALMTRVWEIGGGENWYSPTADRNIRMARAGAPQVFSNGENWETIGTHTHWQGLTVMFENANTPTVFYNDIKDQLTDDVATLQTQLAPGDCLYVDLDRTQNLTGASALVMRKAPMQSLGTPTIPGSRVIIAWRTANVGSVDIYTRDYPYLSNVTILPATTSSVGGVRLNQVAATGSTPTVLTIGANNIVNVGQAPYAPIAGWPALNVVGSGTGEAGIFTGGADGDGIHGIGGSNSGSGVVGFGGTTGGSGITGIGSGAIGVGVEGTGANAGYGGQFVGGSAGAGVRAFSGGFAQAGVEGIGDAAGGVGIKGTAIGGNGRGGEFLGQGSGTGVFGTGGATSGRGIQGTGGGPNGIGGEFTGSGSGVGVFATSGGTINAAGGDFTSVAGTTGPGVKSLGSGTGPGILANGGASDNSYGGEFSSVATNGNGILGTGTGTGTGVKGIGGVTDGVGVSATGLAAGSGLVATGGSSGHGAVLIGNGIGIGGIGIGGNTNGYGLKGIGGTNGTGIRGEGDGSGAGGDFLGGLTDGIGVNAQGRGFGVGGQFTGGSAGGRGIVTVGLLGNYAIEVGAGHAIFTGTAPAKTAAYTNAVTPVNICKAWGSVPPLDLTKYDDGFNLFGAAPAYETPGAGTLTITLGTSMANALFHVDVNVIDVGNIMAQVTSRTAAGGAGGRATFTVRFIVISTGAYSGASDSGYAFSFAVYGRQ